LATNSLKITGSGQKIALLMAFGQFGSALSDSFTQYQSSTIPAKINAVVMVFGVVALQAK
jgi:hypothetical protein